MTNQFEIKIKDLLERGVGEGVFPGCVLLVAKGGHVVFLEASGQLSLLPQAAPMKKDTIFDLASLTKPLATTLALMKLVDQNQVGLDQPLSEIITHARLKDKKDLTPRLLLCHSSGLLDWKPFYQTLMDYDQVERKRIVRGWIIEEPFAYEPGKGCLYSDLGFMMLEWIVEEASGIALKRFVEENFYVPMSLKRTFFNENNGEERFTRDEFAPTEDCPWRKKVIQGVVHDDNAYALGGYSGHSGLFGTAGDVHAIVNMVREHYLGERDDYFKPETVRSFFTRQGLVKESTWALGWDTPSAYGSSSGRFFSRKSVGHLGFTGTSIWMDLELGVVVVFLSNRVHPTRDNEKIKRFRPRLHDVVMKELD